MFFVTVKNQKSKSGFTLIELLVVIAIIGLLASTVMASLSSARMKSRDARRLSDLKQLRTAITLYYMDHKQWPCAGLGGSDSYIDDQNHCLASVLVPDYIPSLPTDPLYGGDGKKQWGNDYQYFSSSNSYTLRTAFETNFLPQDATYPNGSTCQTGGFSKCTWYGRDCVYVTGPSCNITWLHLSENR